MVKITCQIKPHKDSNIKVISGKKLKIYKNSKDLTQNSSKHNLYETELDQLYGYNSKEIYDNEIKNNLYKNFGVFIYGHSESGKKQTLFGNDIIDGIFDLMSKKFEHSYEIEAIDIRYNGTFDLFTENKIILFSNGKENNYYNSVKQKITPENINYYRKIIYDSRNNETPTSHLILYIYKGDKKYHIVDLVNNESELLASNTLNDFKNIFIECSLLTLKKCFHNANKIYMPYECSDLTILLKDINNDSLIICTIREGYEHFYETVDTLKYVDSLLIDKLSKKNKVTPVSPTRLSFLKQKNIKYDKQEIISNRKVLSPRKLFLSKFDLIKNDDRLSPKNINYNKFFDDDTSPLKLPSDYDELEDPLVDLPINDELNFPPPKLSSYYDELEKSLLSSLMDEKNDILLSELSNIDTIYSDDDFIETDSIETDSIESDSDEDNKYNTNLCKNEDCSAIKTSIFSKKCSICLGYFNNDGINDIYFLDKNNGNGKCSLCGKTKNICIMKSNSQYICISACEPKTDESYESEEDESEEDESDEFKEDESDDIDKFSSDIIKPNDIDTNLFDKNYNYDYGDDNVILNNITDIISITPKSPIKNKLEIKSRRKLIGIINNLLYKKIVSNYKILLDDNLTDDDCDKLVINTAATLEVCMQELFRAK